MPDAISSMSDSFWRTAAAIKANAEAEKKATKENEFKIKGDALFKAYESAAESEAKNYLANEITKHFKIGPQEATQALVVEGNKQQQPQQQQSTMNPSTWTVPDITLSGDRPDAMASSTIQPGNQGLAPIETTDAQQTVDPSQVPMQAAPMLDGQMGPGAMIPNVSPTAQAMDPTANLTMPQKGPKEMLQEDFGNTAYDVMHSGDLGGPMPDLSPAVKLGMPDWNASSDVLAEREATLARKKAEGTALGTADAARKSATADMAAGIERDKTFAAERSARVDARAAELARQGIKVDARIRGVLNEEEFGYEGLVDAIESPDIGKQVVGDKLIMFDPKTGEVINTLDVGMSAYESGMLKVAQDRARADQQAKRDEQTKLTKGKDFSTLNPNSPEAKILSTEVNANGVSSNLDKIAEDGQAKYAYLAAAYPDQFGYPTKDQAEAIKKMAPISNQVIKHAENMIWAQDPNLKGMTLDQIGAKYNINMDPTSEDYKSVGFPQEIQGGMFSHGSLYSTEEGAIDGIWNTIVSKGKESLANIGANASLNSQQSMVDSIAVEMAKAFGHSGNLAIQEVALQRAKIAQASNDPRLNILLALAFKKAIKIREEFLKDSARAVPSGYVDPSTNQLQEDPIAARRAAIRAKAGL